MKKKQDFLGKGLLISLLLIVLDLIGGFAHLRFETWFKWVSAGILIVAIIMVCIQFGKQQTDGVTFGKVFGYGFKVSLIIAAIMVVYTLISVYVIFPEFIDEVLVKSRIDMQAKGTYSDTQIDQAMEMTRKFFLPGAIIGVILYTLFVGCIASLIGAALTKKSEPDVFKDNS